MPEPSRQPAADVDLEDLIGDGLTALGWEWEGGPRPATPPQDLIDAVVALVRPTVARLTEERDGLLRKTDGQAKIIEALRDSDRAYGEELVRLRDEIARLTEENTRLAAKVAEWERVHAAHNELHDLGADAALVERGRLAAELKQRGERLLAAIEAHEEEKEDQKGVPTVIWGDGERQQSLIIPPSKDTP
jgi:hypothetical protein